MTFLQRDLDVAILRADGAAVVVDVVGAAGGKADIVDHRCKLAGRDHAADRRFDAIKFGGGFFDSRAHRCAHVQCDGAGIH